MKLIRTIRPLSFASAIFVVMIGVIPVTAQLPDDSCWVKADDSLRLFCKFFPGDVSDKTPVVVALPMMAHDLYSYRDLRAAMHSFLETDSASRSCRMPHVLSPDLRGHGRSCHRLNDSLYYGNMSAAEFAKYPSDVEKIIRTFSADTGRHLSNSWIVVGASIGANTAALLTKMVPNIGKIALLSPGLDYRGLQPAEAVRDFKGDILIFACEGDQYAAQSSRTLAELNPDHCRLHIFPGQNHGTDIINEQPEAMRILLDWIFAGCDRAPAPDTASSRH